MDLTMCILHKPTHARFMALETQEQRFTMIINSVKRNGVFGKQGINTETLEKFYYPKVGSFSFCTDAHKCKTPAEAKWRGLEILKHIKELLKQE